MSNVSTRVFFEIVNMAAALDRELSETKVRLQAECDLSRSALALTHAELEKTSDERDEAHVALDVAYDERGEVYAERDTACAERDAFRANYFSALRDLESTQAELEKASAERGAALLAQADFARIRAMLAGEWWLRKSDSYALIDIDADSVGFFARPNEGEGRSFSTLAEAIAYAESGE